MPQGSVLATIPATADEAFALLHDYDRRLEWDTLLQKAYLTEGYESAQLHAVSVCQGRSLVGGLALKTVYISFQPGKVAAIKMLNRPLFFESFAATIRHEDLSEGTSRIEYKYSFHARPKLLRWVLHPIMSCIFRRETQKRLVALGEYLRSTRSKPEPATESFVH